MEAHLLGFDGDLYGQTLELELIDFVREQIKFSSVEQLKEKMWADMRRCEQLAKTDPARPVVRGRLTCYFPFPNHFQMADSFEKRPSRAQQDQRQSQRQGPARLRLAYLGDLRIQILHRSGDQCAGYLGHDAFGGTVDRFGFTGRPGDIGEGSYRAVACLPPLIDAGIVRIVVSEYPPTIAVLR